MEPNQGLGLSRTCSSIEQGFWGPGRTQAQRGWQWLLWIRGPASLTYYTCQIQAHPAAEAPQRLSVGSQRRRNLGPVSETDTETQGGPGVRAPRETGRSGRERGQCHGRKDLPWGPCSSSLAKDFYSSPPLCRTHFKWATTALLWPASNCPQHLFITSEMWPIAQQGSLL